jgi:Tfp pilus assembly protein PilE
MGQQQLLLIILGVIIVGIAVAVGITMFKTNAVSANRDALVNDLTNLAARAQQFYRRPTSLGGGGQSFTNFVLTSRESKNPNMSLAVVPEVTDQQVTFTATGTEVGDNGTDMVTVVMVVDPDSIFSTTFPDMVAAP